MNSSKIRNRLIRLLQCLHSSGLATAQTLYGHWHGMDSLVERIRIRECEEIAWEHRIAVRGLLEELGARPLRGREMMCGLRGHVQGYFCGILGRTLPLFFSCRCLRLCARRYRHAAELATRLNLTTMAQTLQDMADTVEGQEGYFEEHMSRHRIIPLRKRVRG